MKLSRAPRISTLARKALRTLAVFSAACALFATLLLTFSIALPRIDAQNSARLARINAAVAALLGAPRGEGLDAARARVFEALGEDAERFRTRIETASDPEALRGELKALARETTSRTRAHSLAMVRGAALAALATALGAVAVALALARQLQRATRLFAGLSSLIDDLEAAIGGASRGIAWDGGSWEETRVIARRAANLASELAFSRELLDTTHGAADLDALLESLPAALGRVLPAERVAIAFLDRAGNLVAERAVSQAATIRLDVGFSQPLSTSSLSRLTESRSARIIDDLAAIERPSEATKLILEEGFRSSLATPLFFGERCVGFLFLNAQAPRAYNLGHAALAERLAASLRAPLYHHYVVQLLLAETSRGFVKSMEQKDNETSQHIERMSLYAHAVARELAHDPRYAPELSPRKLREILWFAPLHDIGKIGIPDAILFKQGPLNRAERAVMETHVEMGAAIFREINVGLARYLPGAPLDTAVDIIAGHHEKWDGSGYPRGLRGESIPLAARIAAAADVLDALSSARPYKPAWSFDEALARIEALSGSHFDPAVVRALLAVRPALESIRERHADA